VFWESGAIYQTMLKLDRSYEQASMPTAGQEEISSKLRSVLVDWLGLVREKLGLLHESLFLAVSLMDRVLLARPVPLKALQLVGIAALLIAVKYEEIAFPSMNTFA